jgi:hypothetical protein
LTTSSDFIVAFSELLLDGFPVSGSVFSSETFKI